MKQLKILHTADWHADSDEKKQTKLNASLQQILEYVKENKINVLIHSGDIWDRKQSYSDKSGVPSVILYLRAISKYVDFIFITKGNNSHDEPGSISLLHQLEPNIYAYEYPVCFGVRTPDDIPCDILRKENHQARSDVNYIITLIPYPTKASLLIDDSIDNNNAAFIERFEEIFEHIGEITREYNCPKILAFHGNVVGSRLSSGQTLVSQDIMVAPATLEKAKHDYYALGHIHLRQEIKPNMIYAGSIYNMNWGETEQKSFEVIEFTDESVESKINFLSIFHNTITLTAARPMIKHELEFKNGDFFDAEIGSHYKGYVFDGEAEFRLRIKVNESDRKLITEEKILELTNFFGKDSKIEFNIIPSERESRSEKIMNCKTLLDEVKEYAAVVNEPINGTIEQKILTIQEGDTI